MILPHHKDTKIIQLSRSIVDIDGLSITIFSTTEFLFVKWILEQNQATSESIKGCKSAPRHAPENVQIKPHISWHVFFYPYKTRRTSADTSTR